MEPAEIYAATRTRLIEVAGRLDDALQATSLVPTPPWSVVDAYRHLSGVCTDVLDGATEGAGTAAWTATQIATRADLSLADVCSEWSTRAPALDERMRAAGRAMSFAAFDAWTHEQDVRGAIGLGGARDEIAMALAELAIETLSPRYAASSAPACKILVHRELVLGDADATRFVWLSTTPYDLLRAIFGRRSRAQIEDADWRGTVPDVDAAIDALHVFALPIVDIVD